MSEQLTEFETLAGGAIGVVRLVREKPLNSLLLDTIDQLLDKILTWLTDDAIRCIILDSTSERAFCAGADITALYHSIIEMDGGDNPYAQDFFLHEYRLDHALHTADKPIVVWGNGIVMGGGLGLLGGCSHRIGTPTTRIAMPEITIGLFPDAGGTALLSALPDHLGIFAGLTGCQLSAGDGLELDLLDIIVEPARKVDILAGIARINWTGNPAQDRALVDQALEPLGLKEPQPTALLNHRAFIRDLIDDCHASDDFFVTFEAAAEDISDEWLAQAFATYRSGSAITARVFLEQMRRAEGMSLEQMFQMELVIAYQCIRHRDFPEGVRALLIDKDRNPQWTYAAPGEVPDEVVEQHFEPAWSGAHPLQF